MEFFNFVETFFFVSLAITFVLIMMLVYHFKERLTILEKKTNTMFDIITNIVNELNGIRNHPVSDNNIQHIVSGMSEFPLSETFSQLPKKIVVSDNENDDDENMDDDDDFESDDDEESSDDEDNKIKIINIDLQGNNENIQFEELNESASSTDEDEELYNSVTDFEAYSNMESEKPENNEDLPLASSSSVANEIKVEKSNKKVNEEFTNSYRKMDINALRNLVVERGITADIKKLKKIELIRLLDSNA
jgi:hypothetical protein